MKINKKMIGFIILLILIFIFSFLGLKFIKSQKKDLIDMGDIMNEQATKKTEEQLKLHSMILRNTSWNSDFETISNEEKGNIIDSKNKKYITCDYETMFDKKLLPTYLFDNNKLVAILYEVDLSQEDLSNLALIHQTLATNIHYVYEKLYRENNKWKSGEERKFDNNLWTKAITSGNLTLQSIWNSNDEKVFLLTGNKPFFQFLEKEKDRKLTSSITFIVISDEFLKTKGLKDLVNIIPEGFNESTAKEETLIPTEAATIQETINETN